jgi:hypothetical protein
MFEVTNISIISSAKYFKYEIKWFAFRIFRGFNKNYMGICDSYLPQHSGCSNVLLKWLTNISTCLLPSVFTLFFSWFLFPFQMKIYKDSWQANGLGNWSRMISKLGLRGLDKSYEWIYESRKEVVNGHHRISTLKNVPIKLQADRTVDINQSVIRCQHSNNGKWIV